jgi:hypothetical protein
MRHQRKTAKTLAQARVEQMTAHLPVTERITVLLQKMGWHQDKIVTALAAFSAGFSCGAAWAVSGNTADPDRVAQSVVMVMSTRLEFKGTNPGTPKVDA